MLLLLLLLLLLVAYACVVEVGDAIQRNEMIQPLDSIGLQQSMAKSKRICELFLSLDLEHPDVSQQLQSIIHRETE